MKGIRSMAIVMILLVITLPICFADAISLVYDKNGNLITGDGKYREYNSLNQLSKVYNGSDTSILLAEFTHHLVEERVLKKVSYNLDGSWKENVYYVDDNFVQVKNSSGTFNYTYIKHEGQIVAQEVNGIKTYIHPDHIGSATVVTNAAGATIENTTYTPYGQIISGGEESRYDFASQEYDSVLGDYDHNARRYKAEWGRFTQPDKLLPDLYDPQQLNRYSYSRNNPYRFIDLDGREPVEIQDERYWQWHFSPGLGAPGQIADVIDYANYELSYGFYKISYSSSTKKISTFSDIAEMGVLAAGVSMPGPSTFTGIWSKKMAESTYASHAQRHIKAGTKEGQRLEGILLEYGINSQDIMPRTPYTPASPQVIPQSNIFNFNTGETVSGGIAIFRSDHMSVSYSINRRSRTITRGSLRFSSKSGRFTKMSSGFAKKFASVLSGPRKSSI